MDPLTPSTFLLNAQTQYRYNRLPDDSSFVRLATLTRDADGSLIGSLKHHPTATVPEFNALSYEWGVPGDHVWITVDGRHFRIQKNLASFILAILSVTERTTSDKHVVVFVDAICVDQQNIPERNQQVQLMKFIYSNAVRVLSWLGPPAEGISDLFKLIEGTQLELDRSQLEQLFLRLHGGIQDRFCIYAALDDLMNRSYWKRLWIVQELILAKEIVLYCGTLSIEWTKMDPTKLIEVVKLFKSKWYSDVEKTKIESGAGSKDAVALFEKALARQKLFTYMRWRGGWNQFYASGFSLTEYDTLGENNQDLKHALLDFGENKCLDPRDKIYALLGILKKRPEQNTIVVNYAQNLVGLFFDVWAHISEMDAMKEFRSIRAILRTVFTRLGLHEYILQGDQGSLQKEVVDSIPHEFQEMQFPVKTWYIGTVGSRTETLVDGVPAPSLSYITKDGTTSDLSTWTVKRSFSSQYDDFFSMRRGVGFFCFTLADAQAGDIIIGIDSSNLGMIARQTKSSDEGPYNLIGRCGFARSTENILNIGAFLNRKLPYGAGLTDPDGFERPESSGDYRSVTAVDLLILSTDLDAGFSLKPSW